jgi:uncharacterized protein (DUF1330 family)
VALAWVCDIIFLGTNVSNEEMSPMAKGYWIAFYRSVSDDEALKKYAAMATPVLTAAGARFLARGVAKKAYEAGVLQRTVLVEFDSADTAIRTYESPEYQAALAVIDGKVDRDMRIVEGV